MNQNLIGPLVSNHRQNGTVESTPWHSVATSRKQTNNNVLIHFMQRRQAAFSVHQRTQEHTWSTYHENNNAITIIIMLRMNSEYEYGSWFTPTLCNACCIWIRSRSYHKWTAPELICNLTKTISSRGGPLLSSVSVFDIFVHTRPDEETAPKSFLNRANSSGVQTPSKCV